jgi:acetyl esterase
VTLLENVEAAVFRAVMSLPPGVQRRLAGRPVERDGLVLAPETQLVLRLQRLAREPDVATLPVPEGRRAVRRHAALVGGELPVGSVEPVDLGGVPGRRYLPRGVAAPAPTLLFLHGGGWVYGDLDSHDAVCRFLAEQAGVQVVAVDYRLAPEHPFPAAYDDALAAFRWLVAHADELGADPARLAVGGDSAGGCLAATTAIAAAREGLPLAFQLLVYPATDMRGGTPSRDLFAEGFYLTKPFMDLSQQRYLPDPAALTDCRASPLLADLPAGLAPAYVVTAGFDPLRDEGEAYAERLTGAGVPTRLRRFPGLVHGFFNLVGVGRTSRAANQEIAAALAEGLSARG